MTDEQEWYKTGALPEATLLGERYRVERRLGRGGMGAVYCAYDERLDIKCAIKEMSTALLRSDEERDNARRAFHEEAKLLARLSHPNLPRVSDHFTEDGKEYLVLEYVPGDTLAQILRRNPPPWSIKETMQIAAPLTVVLHYLHTRVPPIIFRDLKPANIMRTPEGVIKLIDFGIARLFKPGQSHDTQAFGTVGYSAPEQYGKGQTDARSDVYALGVLIHQLITAHDPVSQPFNVPEARVINAAIADQFSDVLATAMSHDPDDRFASMVAFRRALENAAEAAQRPSQPFIAAQRSPADQYQYPAHGAQTIPQTGFHPPTPQSGFGPPTPQHPVPPPTPPTGLPYAAQAGGLNRPVSGEYKQAHVARPVPNIQPGYHPPYMPPQPLQQIRQPLSSQPKPETTGLAKTARNMSLFAFVMTLASLGLMELIPMGAQVTTGLMLATSILSTITGFIALMLTSTFQSLKGRRHAIMAVVVGFAVMIMACITLSVSA